MIDITLAHAQLVVRLTEFREGAIVNLRHELDEYGVVSSELSLVWEVDGLTAVLAPRIFQGRVSFAVIANGLDVFEGEIWEAINYFKGLCLSYGAQHATR